ncbi:hypothetical protein IAT38_000236 [Cryptococcus sp. DSM 104549]
MKISNTAPIHLSNYEVLQHFVQQKKDTDRVAQCLLLHKMRQKAWARQNYPIDRDENEEPIDPAMLAPMTAEEEKDLGVAVRRGMSDELAWVQNEVLKYLCSDLGPTARQTDEAVTSMVSELQGHNLTKGEVLQLINHVPTDTVMLYAIVDSAEVRFQPAPKKTLREIGHRMNNLLLEYPPPYLQPFLPKYADQGGAEDYAPEYLDEDAEMGVMEEDTEYVFEMGKEVGVDEEKDGDMD